MKQRYVEQLAEKIGSRLIVDNTQAFYAQPLEDIDTFYTCRKFFGVPDGAYLYTDTKIGIELSQDVSYERMSHLLKRIDLSAEEGYEDFHKNDEALSKQPIMRMSKLTERLMHSIDYEAAAKKRRENYMMLHEALGRENNLELPLEGDAVPMVYPYLINKKGLRDMLLYNKIFVARYWPNVLEWTKSDSIDYRLSNYLLPLPVDQRYNQTDMYRIINTIL